MDNQEIKEIMKSTDTSEIALEKLSEIAKKTACDLNKLINDSEVKRISFMEEFARQLSTETYWDYKYSKKCCRIY